MIISACTENPFHFSLRVFFFLLFIIINTNLGGFFMRKINFQICRARSILDGGAIDKAEKRIIFEEKKGKRKNQQKKHQERR